MTFLIQLRKAIGQAFDQGRASLPDPTHGQWPVEPARSEAIQAVENLVLAEIRQKQSGPPMAFLGCTLKQDYSDRLFRVTSVGEGSTYFAQLMSVDEPQEFLEVDTATLLRDFAVVPSPDAPVIRLGDE